MTVGERELGAGRLFFCSLDSDDFEPVGEIAVDGIVFETVEDDAGSQSIRSKQQIYNLMCEVYGFKKLALDQMRESGHGRIAHLATRARKRKTRKKNLHRAYSALRIP